MVPNYIVLQAADYQREVRGASIGLASGPNRQCKVVVSVYAVVCWVCVGPARVLVWNAHL